MQELEEQAIRRESKSHCDFLSACQAILCHAPQSLKENLTTSYHVLLGQSPLSSPSSHLARTSPAEEQPSVAASPGQYPNSPHSQKGGILCQSHGESTSIDELPHRPHRKDQPAPRDKGLPPGLPSSNPVMQKPSVKTLTL